MKLKEFRERLGLSQRKLGEILGVSSTTIFKYEKGEFEPSIENLIKMADIFNVSVDSLIGNDSPMLDLRALDDNQREVIDNLLRLSPTEVAEVNGYIKGIIKKKST